ncbi:MAG: iron-containing alcohol dehydrogenase [Mediterraneibacter gnavus]
MVANPTITNIEEARTLYLESGTKAIIAFGGGSAMDCAKVTGACIVKPNKPIHKMKGLLRICKKLPLCSSLYSLQPVQAARQRWRQSSQTAAQSINIPSTIFL